MKRKLFLAIALLSISKIAITQNVTIDFDESSGQSRITLASGVSVVENGKVFALTTINQNVLYRVFLTRKEETDLGPKYLKYRDSRGKLLWQIQLLKKELFCNNEKKVIIITYGKSELQFYLLATGKLLETVALGGNYLLNDGCECVSTSTTTYIKYADPENFETKEVMVISNENVSNFTIIKLRDRDYYSLRKSLDGENVFLLRDGKIDRFLNGKPNRRMIEYIDEKGKVVKQKI